MNEEEIRLSEEALNWVKKNSKSLIQQFMQDVAVAPNDIPTTLFMAGSPGAGKTEVSKRLMEGFEQKPLRIDADEIRALCPGYVGTNAHVFQRAATKGVHILFDHVLHAGVNVILDGTFAYADALKNIQRCLEYKRSPEIFFVYQDPLKAWEFVKFREQEERRRVTKETFIESFFKSKDNVQEAKRTFGGKLDLTLLIKDFDGQAERLELNIDSVDPYLTRRYTPDSLKTLLT